MPAAPLGAPSSSSRVSPPVPPQGKELPTLKDVDFLNKNEKVFVGEEQQREFMDKLKRDVEVGNLGGGSCTPREPLRGAVSPPTSHGRGPHP